MNLQIKTAAGSAPSAPPAARAARGQRRGDLLAAALACFSERGVEGTTVEMILGRCGASVGSLYQHFNGKDGLALALFLEGIDAYFRHAQALFDAEATTEGGVKALVRAYIDRVVADPAMATFLLQARPYLAKTPHEAEIARKNQEFFPALFTWFSAKIEEGAIRRLPPECLVPIISGPVRDYARLWLTGRAGRPIAELREVFAQAAWDAVRPVRGRPARRKNR